jgi:hypothetical protein
MKIDSDRRENFFRILCGKTYFFKHLGSIEDAQTNAKKPETFSATGFDCGRQRSEKKRALNAVVLD